MPGDNIAAVRSAHLVPLTPKDADFSGFRVVGDSQHADPKRPTVAFLDIFDDTPSTHPTYFDDEWNPVSHGETSAGPAEKRGYNVLRLDYMDKRFHDDADLPRTLNEIAANIKTGRIRLSKGDALNVSFQSFRYYYPEMGRLVDMNITPENVKQNRSEILKRVCQPPDSSKLTVAQLSNVHQLCDMTRAINRIRSQGVEVVSIAGNDGKYIFDWGFLAADKIFSAVDDEGTLFKFSGTNDITVPKRGSYAVTYERQNLFSPEPLAKQLGIYKFDHSPVYFEAKNVHGIHSSRNFYAPIDGQGHLSDPSEPADFQHVLEPQRIASIKQLSSDSVLVDTVADVLKPHHITTQRVSAPSESVPMKIATSFAAPLEQIFTKDLSKLRVNEKFLGPYPFEKHPVLYVPGTSFSNIQYFWDNYERFARLKNHKR